MTPSPDGQGASREFIERMNKLPKYVASRTLHEVGWNASLLGPDLGAEVAALKALPGQDILKYGTGTLDRVLMPQGLIDEFHLWLMPVALGRGQRIFQNLAEAHRVKLVNCSQFRTGVVVLTYVPER
jgi:dihydrofolate reductase